MTNDDRATTTSSSRDAELKNSTGNAGVGTSGQATDTTTRRSLPRTASNLPLLGLLSAVSLALGVGLRRVRAA